MIKLNLNKRELQAIELSLRGSSQMLSDEIYKKTNKKIRKALSIISKVNLDENLKTCDIVIDKAGLGHTNGIVITNYGDGTCEVEFYNDDHFYNTAAVERINIAELEKTDSLLNMKGFNYTVKYIKDKNSKIVSALANER